MTKEGIPAYPEFDNYGQTKSQFEGSSPSSVKDTSTPSGNNDGGQSIQDYYDDYTNLTGTTVITDKDRDDFFKARPDYKIAAKKAAKTKADQKEKAKKEQERFQNILDANRGREPKAYSYGKPINNYKKEYFIGPNKFSTATKMRQLALKNLIDQKMGTKPLPIGFNFLSRFKPAMQDQDYTYASGITTDMMGIGLTPEQQAERLQDYFDMDKYGMTGKNLTDIDRMNRALDTGRATGKITQQQFEDAFNSQVIPGGGDNRPTINRNMEYIPGRS